MHSGLQLVLARLETMGLRPRRQKDCWIGYCPSHENPPDGHQPSLSVRLSEDGQRVLLHCFAGCSAEEVLKAMNIEWWDLKPDSWRDWEGPAPKAARPPAASARSANGGGHKSAGGQQDGNGQPGKRYPSAEAALAAYGQRHGWGRPNRIWT